MTQNLHDLWFSPSAPLGSRCSEKSCSLCERLFGEYPLVPLEEHSQEKVEVSVVLPESDSVLREG